VARQRNPSHVARTLAQRDHVIVDSAVVCVVKVEVFHLNVLRRCRPQFEDMARECTIRETYRASLPRIAFCKEGRLGPIRQRTDGREGTTTYNEDRKRFSCCSVMPQMTTVPYENKKISASPVPTMSHLLPLRFAVAVGGVAVIVASATASSGTPSRSPAGVGAGAPAWASQLGVSTAVAVVVSPSDPELRHFTDAGPRRGPRPPGRPPLDGALFSSGAADGGSGRPYEYVV
jgi:hypothetical protein